jgi:hypothetical protein
MESIMITSIDELETRLLDLKKLADQLTADKRWLSSPLEEKDGMTKEDALVSMAESLRVPILHPLTIGTLLASVLGEIDSVECALKSLLRKNIRHESWK